MLLAFSGVDAWEVSWLQEEQGTFRAVGLVSFAEK